MLNMIYRQGTASHLLAISPHFVAVFHLSQKLKGDLTYTCSDHPVSQTLDHASVTAETPFSTASVQAYFCAFQSMDLGFSLLSSY